ncbi:MAG: hypothetical protein JRI55_06095 [Deltaproteobacteria bacterium]|jgi:hypothetical protein|nr:hypothetical protein [Deltaproteobacteria bacterium]
MDVAGATNCFSFCRQNGGECLRAYDATADECTAGQSQVRARERDRGGNPQGS